MNPAHPASRALLLALIATACSPEELPLLVPSSEGRMRQELARPEPYLVQNIRVGTHGAVPFDLTDVNGTLYFTANDGLHGRELWKSDGTESGTALVEDITPGAGSPDIKPVGALGSTFFFSTPEQLWKTDGTTAGTVAIREGALRFETSSVPLEPGATLNGALFFFASGQGTTGKQLWRTDGTEAGSLPVSGDLPIFSYARTAYFLLNVNGTLLFMGLDSTGTNQLWKSDGTAAGTTFVGNLPADSGTPRGGSEGRVVPQVIGGALFFETEPFNGPLLWKTDGTMAGTVLLKAGTQGSRFSQLTAVGGTLFFVIDGALWRSDGTSAGTVAVNSPSENVSWLSSVGGVLFIGTGNGLYRSDGTPAGTTLLKQLSVHSQHAAAGGATLLFTASMPGSPAQLWKSDGTNAGTTPVTSIRLGSYSTFEDSTLPTWRVSFTPQLVAAGNLVFFLGREDVAGQELWRSDGTSAGTFRASDINLTGLDASPRSLTAVGDTLFFTATDGFADPALWKSDGTGAIELKALNGSVSIVGASLLTASGGKLLFSRISLWASDGTEPGTVSLSSPNPTALLDRNGTAFFTSGDFVLGKSDGTRAGTVVIKRTETCCSGGAGSELVDVNGTLYFVGSTMAAGSELWKSDGTEAGTVLVKDIHPGNFGSFIRDLTASNGRLFFFADDGTSQGLWTSDGTERGTLFLGAEVDQLADLNGTLLFAANERLSKTDGTAAGTRVLKEFYSGPSSSLSPMIAMNGALFFVASDGQTGAELWKSDGTEAGTVLVRDISPGPGSSLPLSLTNVNGLLYFLASDDGLDYELWRSDGTEAGTFAVSTQLHGLRFLSRPLGWPESPGEAPRMAKARGTIFFAARDVLYGHELWAMPLSALTCPSSFAVEATSGSGAVVSYPSPTVAPDATGTPGFTYDPPAGRPLPLGATQVSVSSVLLPPYPLSSCDFTVTVRDTTPPTVSCPDSQVARVSSSAGGAVLFPPATATDAATASPAIHYSQDPGSTFLPGSTEVTVTATDEAGNTASCGFTVTVEIGEGGEGGEGG
ncbi:ELWxxDGT repeat protein, partial [Hyalangium sp.]|uniref:ELWxxDGT repeat protein n=1 Tax=Hyalangium sp. TaxID=2028555 RepID=UPI002D45D1F1